MKKQTIIAKSTHQLKTLISQEIDSCGYYCDLNHIDVSSITDLSQLFWDSKFNGDISNWNVAKAENMASMFYNSAFNGDISKWDVSNVTSMQRMFGNSKFNGNLSSWTPYRLKFFAYMFDNCQSSTPYWFGYREKEIIEVIKNYQKKIQFHEKLNNDLNNHQNIKKRKI